MTRRSPCTIAGPRMRSAVTNDFRLIEVLGALSLTTDLANGNPMGSALRSGELAIHISRELGVTAEETSQACYAALMRHIGCTSYSHEEAGVFGDELASRRLYSPIETSDRGALVRASVTKLGKGLGMRRRVRAVAKTLSTGTKLRKEMIGARCEVAVHLASRIGLGDGVSQALAQMYERWDGKGMTSGLAGEAISLAARISHVATEAELHNRTYGPNGAIAMIRKRTGGHFDPKVANAFLRVAEESLATQEDDAWNTVLALEWTPSGRTPIALDDIIRAFADYVDLKSVYTLGHSSGVAALAEAAGKLSGLDADECTALRRAALLHDLGRAGVPNSIWERKGKLTIAEWEQVRLHPYFTDRILRRSPLLSELAPIAAAHHERADGSGYPRNVPASMIVKSARLLAAADVYHALTETRPQRPALGPNDAAATLLDEVKAGRLDREAANAVLEAAGHDRPRTVAARPAGLTDREIEVLRLVARGHSNKQIAEVLGISARTAQHHVIHIYAKIGVSSRAAAALFAVEHGVLESDGT
jgi:HD-GYP domain-containing protein (c-di-GMP phosphodiesterase class II)